MNSLKLVSLCSTALLLAACAETPMGPTVRILPSVNKPFERFQEEQARCKQYADEQVRNQAGRANETSFLQGLGATALGAGLGAAIDGGRGAAIGAAGGAVAGTAVGASTSTKKQGSIQQQYDDAYVQCMVAKGNLIERPAVQTAPQTTVIYQQTPPPPPPTVIYTQPAPQPPPSPYYTR
ncbi:MAG: hypothetical protein WC464_01440 [Bdellovibrionales bacterium]